MSSVYFAHSGDRLLAEDNITTPTVAVLSSPITITDPIKSIMLSNPGNAQATSAGAGVTVTETVTTKNITGHVDLEVVTSSGSVDGGWIYPNLINGSATVQMYFAHSGDSVVAVDNITTPTVVAQSAPITITNVTSASSLAQSLMSYPQGLTAQQAYTDVALYNNQHGGVISSLNGSLSSAASAGSLTGLSQNVKELLFPMHQAQQM